MYHLIIFALSFTSTMNLLVLVESGYQLKLFDMMNTF